MDNRASFVELFIEDDFPIYYDDISSAAGWLYRYWESHCYKVKRWNGDVDEKYLYFYKSRFISKSADCNSVLEYVIVPSFKNPRWVILNKKDVISKHGSIIKPTSLKARLVWGVAKMLNRFHLFTVVFPDRFVAKRSRMGVTIFNKNGYTPNILYTGAVGEYQKFTIQYCDEHNRPAYYLKLANTKGGVDRIINEYSALEKLEDIEMEYMEVPKPIEKIISGKFHGFLQNNILSNEKVIGSLLEADILAIGELYNRFGVREIGLSEYLREIGFQECGDELLLPHCYFETIEERSIFLASSHGDYIPWNRFVSINKVKAIDWEAFKYRPLFYDICYFLVHKVVLIEKLPVKTAVNESILYINKLLSNLNKSTDWIESVDVEFYILISLVELYLHYKSNNHVADQGFLINIRDAIIRLQKQLSE